MKKYTLLAFALSSFFLFSAYKAGDSKEKEVKVLISTTMGDITIKLYNETPKHRDNFIKLVENHTYDSLMFHRVIEQFMIQGGDPESKRAIPGTMLGNGNVGYTIPAEIIPQLYHKRGALAAARMGDEINPQRESSGCQFYIVQGKSYTSADLDFFEAQKNTPFKQKIFGDFISKEENKAFKEKFIYYQQNGKNDSLQLLVAQIEPTIQKELEKIPHFTLSEDQRKSYTTIGGTPHLDGNYTVFGEVIEGMDIVDKIAAVPVDASSRPLSDLRIIKAQITKK